MSSKWDRKPFNSRTTCGVWEREKQVPEICNSYQKRDIFKKESKKKKRKDEKVLELSGMQKGPKKMAKIQIEVKKKKIWIVGNYKICDEVYENKQKKLVILAYKVMSG